MNILIANIKPRGPSAARASKKKNQHNAPRVVIQMHPVRIGAPRGDGRGIALWFYI